MAEEKKLDASVIPEWVSEGSVHKYHRVLIELKKANKEATEEAVKEGYVKHGGLVLDKDNSEVIKEPTKVQKATLVKRMLRK